MRVCLPHLVVAALVLVVAVLVLTSIDTEARRYILTDGFNGVDYSEPDSVKWETNALYGTQEVYVKEGLLHTDLFGHSDAGVEMVGDFFNENVTMTVDFMIMRGPQRPVEIMYMGKAGSEGYVISIFYDQDGWGYDGAEGAPPGSQPDMEGGTWYSVELTVLGDVLNFHLRTRDDNVTVFSMEDLNLTVGSQRHHFSLGVRSSNEKDYPYTVWDNFELYDPYMDPNVLPVWKTVPTLQAVEERVLVYDFSPYVTDDQPPYQLSVTSDSPFVINQYGLTAEFLFHESPGEVVDILMVLSDTYARVPKVVKVDVEAVNDPPRHNVPATMTAVEGTTTNIDLAPYIADNDTMPRNIQLIVASQYVTVEGLMLTLLFPEGTPNQTIEIGISDGVDVVYATVTFIVTTLNNPPTLSYLEDMTVEEDVAWVLDLTGKVHDPDDHQESLALTVSSKYCQVTGMVLTFNYTVGPFSEVVLVRVSDGVGYVQRAFKVDVLARNDPPVVPKVIVRQVQEDRVMPINLAEEVSDEDTETGMLTVSVDHPYVASTVGLTIYVLVPEGDRDVEIPFTVRDEESGTSGKLRLHVLEVNDEPEITGIGNMTAPYYIRAASGTRRSYVIWATDDDDTDLRFTVDSIWEGLSVSGDELVVEPDRLEDGDNIGFLNVYDNRGGTDRVMVNVHVVLKENLPVNIIIRSPVNHTELGTGEEVTFRVRVDDPDGYLVGPVSIIWTSDVVGHMGTLSLEEGGDLTVSGLPSGPHTISVEVDDGQLHFKEWIIVHVGGGEDTTSDVESLVNLLCVIMFVAVGMVVIALVYIARGNRTKEAGPEKTPTAAGTGAKAPPSDDRDARLERERRARIKREETARERERVETARARREEEEREARIRAQRDAEDRRKVSRGTAFSNREGPPTPPPVPPVVPPAPKVPTPPTVPETTAPPSGRLPTEEEMMAGLPALTRALENVPGGLPSDLSLYDPPTIAKRLAKGRKRLSPDGRMLAFVQGHWYYGDPRDPEFMRPYEGN